MDNLAIGQKIREFRQRAKMSQIDLELEIGAASGCISRTETGKINPGKESILKIAKVLNLSPEETASLFGIKLNRMGETGFGNHDQLYGRYQTSQESTYDLLQNLDIDKTFEDAIKKIEELGYINICIYLIDSNTETFKLRRTTVADATLDLAQELLRKNINEVEYSMTDSTLITQAILSGEIQVSSQLFELIIPHLGELYSLQISDNTQHVVALPMKIKSKVIGCITFQTKNSIINTEIINILEKLAESVSKSVYTIEIKNQIDNNLNKAKEIVNEKNDMKQNLLEIFTYQNFLYLWQNEVSMRIFTVLFGTLTLYWIINQLVVNNSALLYELWGHMYYFMALFVVIVGYNLYKFIGGNHTHLGKMVLLLILISCTHLFGQIYNSVFALVTSLSIFPYPSLSDIGFLSGTILSMALSIFIYVHLRHRYRIKTFTIYNNVVIISSIILLLVIKYYALFKAYDEQIPNLAVIVFDSAYIIAECVGLAFAILGLVSIRRAVMSKEAMFFLSLFFYSSIILYLCDMLFSYEYYQEIYIWGNEVDFLYFLYYSLIAFGHVALHATIKKDIAIQNKGTEIRDYRYAVDKVVDKMVS